MAETITSTELIASGGYVNLGNHAALRGLTARTIVYYGKPTSIQNPGVLVTKGGNTSLGPRLQISSTNANLSYVTPTSASTTLPVRSTTASTFSFDEWQWWGFTWDGSTTVSSNGRFFKNGEPFSSGGATGSGTPYDGDGESFYLFNRPDNARTTLGSHAYVAVWSRVLSDAEMETVYAEGPLSVPDDLELCWANNQDYSANGITATARSTFASGDTPPNTSLGGTTTEPPVLSSPTVVSYGATTATCTVSTSSATGTLYYLVSENATEATSAVKAGESQAVTAIGVQEVSLTGLAAETTYYVHFIHTVGSDDSDIAITDSFTTIATPTKGASVTLYSGSIKIANVPGIVALWWDATTPSGAPDYETTEAAIDADGVVTIDLDAATALDIGDNGFLFLYKSGVAGQTYSRFFAGIVAVSNIA